jgi:hypothetical protein
VSLPASFRRSMLAGIPLAWGHQVPLLRLFGQMGFDPMDNFMKYLRHMSITTLIQPFLKFAN